MNVLTRAVFAGFPWLLTAMVFSAEVGEGPRSDTAPGQEDPFSRVYEKSLTVSALYALTTRTLTLTIVNLTDDSMRFNEPVLMSAGNISISWKEGFYPPIGSGIYTRKPAQVSAGKTVDFVYLLEEGALKVTEDAVLEVGVYLDGVNEETKRTPYRCRMRIVK